MDWALACVIFSSWGRAEFFTAAVPIEVGLRGGGINYFSGTPFIRAPFVPL